MIQNKPFAHFGLRALAQLTEGSIYFLPHAVFLNYLASSNSITHLVYNFFLYLLVLVLPWYVFLLGTHSILVAKKGGDVGKLLTGLEVLDKNGEFLSMKQSLFRHFIGYTFSWVFFGLGYWNVFTDPQKRAWHDKAIGSFVVKKSNLWPLSLTVLFFMCFLNIYFVFAGFSTFLKGPVKTEIMSFYQTINTPLPKTPSKTTQKYIVSNDFKKKHQEIYNLMDRKQYAIATEETLALLPTAQTTFEKAIVYRILGEIADETGKKDTAEEQWLKAIELAPNYAYTYHLLSKLETETYNDKEALTYALTAVQLDSTVAEYHNDLAIAYYNLRQDTKAVAAIKKALELDPTNEVYKKNLKQMQQGL